MLRLIVFGVRGLIPNNFAHGLPCELTLCRNGVSHMSSFGTSFTPSARARWDAELLSFSRSDGSGSHGEARLYTMT